MTSTRFPRSALRAGVIALGLHGVVAASRSDDDFGRILAACGGIFVAGPIAWGMVADGCPGRGGKDSAGPV